MYVVSAVQVSSIPHILAGNDCLIKGHTGSGKTAAFLAPILQTFLSSSSGSGIGGDASTLGVRGPRLLVLAPGRELASQIAGVTRQLLPDLSVALIIGGVPATRQIEALRKKKPACVVGTPGRVAEMLKEGKLNLRELRVVVLDEFDNLLMTDAHKEAAETVYFALRKRHADLQTILCSATADGMSEGQHRRFLNGDYATADADGESGGGGDTATATATVATKNKELNLFGEKIEATNPLARTTLHGMVRISNDRLKHEVRSQQRGVPQSTTKTNNLNHLFSSLPRSFARSSTLAPLQLKCWYLLTMFVG